MDVALVASVTSAVVVAIGSSVTAPLILSHRTEKMHREDREADWARQDEQARLLKAEQAAQAQAAMDVAHKAAEAAQLLLGVNEQQAAAADATNAKLDTISEQSTQINNQVSIVHGLVNQRLTDATERALAATVALLASRQEMVDRIRETGETPTQQALDLIDQTRKEILDLQNNLSYRATQQAKVDAAAAAPPSDT